MDFQSLLRKELYWVRHNLVALAFVLLLLPAAFAYTTVAFQQVIPRDTPVGVVPVEDDVTQEEIDVVNGAAAFFSEPTVYDSEAAAMHALEREDVYGVLQVRHGMFEENRTVRLTFVVEEEMVPYEQPSLAITSILRSEIRDAPFPADVRVERESVGEDRILPEFLLPTGTLLVMMVFAFGYVPYNLAHERRVFRRLRVESSLWAVVASKFVVFTLLMAVPLVTAQGIASYLSYEVTLLDPGAVGIYLLTFLYLTAVSVGVMFVTRFSTLGRFVNVVFMFGLLTLSSLIYPAGFFSPLRREIARHVPLHYSMIVARGTALKNQSIALYTDHVLVLVGVTVLALAWLALAIVYYERRA